MDAILSKYEVTCDSSSIGLTNNVKQLFKPGEETKP